MQQIFHSQQVIWNKYIRHVIYLLQDIGTLCFDRLEGVSVCAANSMCGGVSVRVSHHHCDAQTEKVYEENKYTANNITTTAR